MTPAGVTRLREWMKLAAIRGSLLVGSTLVAVVICEMVVRLTAPQQLILLEPDLWEPADTVGWLHRPHASVRINTGEGTVDVFTDANRHRVGESGPSAGTKTVLVLGDSYMEALQVEHERSFSALLEQRLSRDLETSIAVRNAGVGGWGPEQYLLRAGALMQQEHFDLVLTALYLGNDIVPRRYGHFPPRPHTVRHAFRFPTNLSRREFVDAFLRPVNDALEVRSHLYIFFRTRLHSLRMRLGLAPLNFPSPYLKAQRSAGDWAVTAEIVADIDRLASENGSHGITVLIPAPFQVDSARFNQYMQGFGLDPEQIDLDQPNDLLAAELAIRGVHVMDPLPAFRVAFDQGARLFGAVDQHFSPEGHRLLTELTAPLAAELLRGDSSSH